MKPILDSIKNNPVILGAIVMAALNLALAFGAPLTAVQIAEINTAVGLVIAAIVRSKTTGPVTAAKLAAVARVAAKAEE